MAVTRLVGTVKDFNSKRGFGYILPDDGGERVFCHWKAIQSDDRWPRLEKGMKVKYELEEQDGKTRAANVTTTKGKKIVLGTKEEMVYSEYCYPGVVKWFNSGSGKNSGFGFITLSMQAQLGDDVIPETTDIYVSREEVLTEDPNPRLVRNMEVEFIIAKTQSGKFAATDVTLPGRVLVEIPKRQR
jgi:CspA family cold shock protein